MNQERFRWLAGVIAAHPNRDVFGRTRLQKTIKLLQRLGLPTDYTYTIHFYGPYSEGVQADIGLLERLELAEETERLGQDGIPYYVIHGKPEAVMEEIVHFQHYIDTMSDVTAVVLELAATYDAFRQMDSDHNEALQRLRRKKGDKCSGGNEEAALQLLRTLGLSDN